MKSHIDAWALRPVCPDLRRRRAHSERAVKTLAGAAARIASYFQRAKARAHRVWSIGHWLTVAMIFDMLFIVACLMSGLSPALPAIVQAAPAQPTRQSMPTAQLRIAQWMPKSILQWQDIIVEEADAQGVDPNLVGVIMRLESKGDPRAVSSSGCKGLMQLRDYNLPSGANPFDPRTSIRAGVHYISYCLSIFHGDVSNALACYNAGPTGARTHPWPLETRTYVALGLGYYSDVSQNFPYHQW